MSDRSRRQVLGALGGMGTITATGCLTQSENTDNVFRVSSPWTPGSMDPAVNGFIFKRIGIMETLVTASHEADVAPGLATSWSANENAQLWEFELRDDIVFHDNSEMDVETTVAALRRAFEAPALADVPFEGIDAVDENRIELRTTTPFVPLPAHMTRPETAVLAPESFDGDSIEEPIGTGPFTFESWDPGSSITAGRNDDYYGTIPELDGVVYEGIEEDQTRLLNLQNDELDMARILPVSDIETLNDDDDATVHAYPIPRSRYIVFDTDSEPFDDRGARQAVLHAIDREELTETLLEGVTDPAVGPFPVSVTDWANEALEPYGYDPDRAVNLLADVGWTAEGSGPLTRDGTPFEIDIWTYSERPVLPQIAEIVQSQLSDIGIDVSVTLLESSTIADRAESEAFDAYLWSNSLLWYPDPDRLGDLFHSERSETHSGYANPQVDELLRTGRETVDMDHRKELYDEIQEIVHEDLPIAFLTDYTNVVATRESVENYTPHPLESTYGLENVTL